MAGLKPNDADVRLGARLNEARRAASLTQRQVASEISVSAAQLQKYEKGINRISAVQLAIVARLTSKPFTWFLDVESGLTVDEQDALLARITVDVRRDGSESTRLQFSDGLAYSDAVTATLRAPTAISADVANRKKCPAAQAAAHTGEAA